MTCLVSKITDKINQMNTMAGVKYPDFLNTKKKYTECVKNILTVKQFENIFLKLLQDDNISMIDIMKIMAKLEKDVVQLHGNNDILTVLDMAEAIINYHIANSKEKVHADLFRQKQQENEVEYATCDCEEGNERYMKQNEEAKSGHFVCDCDIPESVRRNSC